MPIATSGPSPSRAPPSTSAATSPPSVARRATASPPWTPPVARPWLGTRMRAFRRAPVTQASLPLSSRGRESTSAGSSPPSVAKPATASPPWMPRVAPLRPGTPTRHGMAIPPGSSPSPSRVRPSTPVVTSTGSGGSPATWSPPWMRAAAWPRPGTFRSVRTATASWPSPSRDRPSISAATATCRRRALAGARLPSPWMRPQARPRPGTPR